jgi:hypothetical protein
MRCDAHGRGGQSTKRGEHVGQQQDDSPRRGVRATVIGTARSRAWPNDPRVASGQPLERGVHGQWDSRRNTAGTARLDQETQRRWTQAGRLRLTDVQQQRCGDQVDQWCDAAAAAASKQRGNATHRACPRTRHRRPRG